MFCAKLSLPAEIELVEPDALYILPHGSVHAPRVFFFVLHSIARFTEHGAVSGSSKSWLPIPKPAFLLNGIF